MQIKQKILGFTLIELLVVISIIGVLISLSIFGIEGARKSSRDARRKADLELIRSGLEIYKSDCGGYPDSGSLTWGGVLNGDGSTGCLENNSYISQIPADPISPARNYYYTAPTTSTYILCASLESGSGAISGCGNCGEASCNYQVKNP